MREDRAATGQSYWLEHTSAVQVFLLGGSWSGLRGGKNGEILSNGAWSLLSGVVADVILTDDPYGVYRADNHGWFFGWSNGEGASRTALWLCPVNSWRAIPMPEPENNFGCTPSTCSDQTLHLCHLVACALNRERGCLQYSMRVPAHR
jgi:hypothetical protein